MLLRITIIHTLSLHQKLKLILHFYSLSFLFKNIIGFYIKTVILLNPPIKQKILSTELLPDLRYNSNIIYCLLEENFLSCKINMQIIKKKSIFLLNIKILMIKF